MTELSPLSSPVWLNWAREIQALSQTGLTYNTDDYNVQRYRRFMEIAAEIVQTHTGQPAEPWRQNFLVQPGYATPKVDVRAAAFRDGRILLVQEREDNGWTLPGGWADVGDAPAEIAIRETKEESGFDVRP